MVECGGGLLVTHGFQEWHNLPVGSWAWPQAGCPVDAESRLFVSTVLDATSREVAMYQILIDRFATTSPQHCEKLTLIRRELFGLGCSDWVC